MLTKAELEFYERLPMTLSKLTEEIAKLREAVEKCTGRPAPSEEGNFFKPEHPKDSPSDCLAVTKVDVFPFKSGAMLGKMKGLASVVLNDQFMVRGLRIMDGENGLFVGYPNDPFYRGEDFRSVCLPITRQLREHIEYCVLEKYLELTKEA